MSRMPLFCGHVCLFTLEWWMLLMYLLWWWALSYMHTACPATATTSQRTLGEIASYVLYIPLRLRKIGNFFSEAKQIICQRRQFFFRQPYIKEDAGFLKRSDRTSRYLYKKVGVRIYRNTYVRRFVVNLYYVNNKKKENAGNRKHSWSLSVLGYNRCIKGGRWNVARYTFLYKCSC